MVPVNATASIQQKILHVVKFQKQHYLMIQKTF